LKAYIEGGLLAVVDWWSIQTFKRENGWKTTGRGRKLSNDISRNSAKISINRISKPKTPTAETYREIVI